MSSHAPVENPVFVEIVTNAELAPSIAAVAAETFPLACPPASLPTNIAAHIENELSAARFAAYITDDDHDVIAAFAENGSVLGYSLVVHTGPDDPDVLAAVRASEAGAAALDAGTTAELSKMYVLPDHHAAHSEAKPAHALMAACLRTAREHGATYVWLGVNTENIRAHTYYRKMGFQPIGTKTFNMNGVIEHDTVMGQSVSPID